jgi:hypothetical protein
MASSCAAICWDGAIRRRGLSGNRLDARRLVFVAALRWQAAEADRLSQEAIPAAAFVRAWRLAGTLPYDASRDEVRALVAQLRDARAARDRSDRLLAAIIATPRKGIAPLWSLPNRWRPKRPEFCAFKACKH